MFSTNQNFVTNRIELWTILHNLACNSKEAEKLRLSGAEFDKVCKYKSDETNKMRDWNSVDLTICYIPKFGNELKNNPKSDYAKECYKNGKEKHGIEFRVINFYDNLLNNFQQIKSYLGQRIAAQNERNIFISWHLFSFVRNLIRSSVLEHRHFDNIKISTLLYIEAFDIFEIKANIFMEKLEELNIFNNDFVVQFNYNNAQYTRNQMLMSLRQAECEYDIIYPAHFRDLNRNTNVLLPFLAIIFRHSIIPTEQATLTTKECNEIIPNCCDSDTAEINTPFYVFYYNVSFLIQKKLEQEIINPYLIQQIRDENDGKIEREYDTDTEFAEINNGNEVPPQLRVGVITQILQECLVMKGGQQQTKGKSVQYTASGSRRGRRD
uniref:Uncharacterized protein n=1 Tax=Meloidogyne javanica TaxID=6303 RepID=A0A915LKA3_MELJA